MFIKILIANRGEIACRVIKAARKMGIQSVAVYSDADRRALHVRMADESVHIGAAPSIESYLKGDIIIKAALETGAQAIHPGYGFLSENAEFAEACEKAGLVFIGPSAKAIRSMGLKDRAKEIMEEAGVPVVPGYHGDNQDTGFLQEQAEKIGYPVLIKAVAGGGGKGMRVVEDNADFAQSLKSCRREAKASFGNDLVLIEKYLTKPRHIEVQVFGDRAGNVIHLFERDCSLQRRHQKVVEEAPAPGISEDMRSLLGNAAVKAAKAISYYGAGTIEFIVKDADFYFMEMNTRLQVEHPVTEMITGCDLVEWQLRVAAGEKLPVSQEELSINGHAFEVRIYAEDPANDFLPQTGRVDHFSVPANSRIDTGVEAGDNVTIHYDPMIAKLITWGENRHEAALKMRGLLGNTFITGLSTNQEFLSNIFEHKGFMQEKLDTGFIAQNEQDLIPDNYGKPDNEEFALAALYIFMGLGNDDVGRTPWDTHDNWRMGKALPRSIVLINKGAEINITARCYGMSLELEELGIKANLVSYDGRIMTAMVNDAKIEAAVVSYKRHITLFHKGRVVALQLRPYENIGEKTEGGGSILAPMPGKIVKVMVKEGETVVKDQPLLIMESMKVEITIKAKCDGMVEELPVADNDQVQDGDLLVNIMPQEEI